MRCISFVAVASLALFAIALTCTVAQVPLPVPGEPQVPQGVADPSSSAAAGETQESTAPQPTP
ncbi:hypothetical protein IWQ61_000682 [Dispira simplex]|nr:hypothetical protein IWQ61_000682 [Dispira simplex]